MFRTSNPVLNQSILRNAQMTVGEETMTIEGTASKTIFALVIAIAAAYIAWINPAIGAYAMLFAIAGFVCAIVITFKPPWARTLTPVYAAVEGFFLGAVSHMFELTYQGIVQQAVFLTFGTLACMMIVYRSGIIPVTNKLRVGIAAATGAICLVYFASFIASFFGASFSFLHDSSPISIGISVIVVIVAAFSLLLDFDIIEKLASRGTTPKYMEWYGAFTMMVTLVWLYFEILRLLSKLRNR